MAADVGRTIGTARRIDQLGRVVVPAELRKLLGIHTGDLLDFRIIEGQLALLKVDPECALCGCATRLVEVNTKHVCIDCLHLVRGFALV